ncbi:MAG: putative aminohydrolase SsnA [Candidatus Bipolaricaulaceae bacterium]
MALIIENALVADLGGTFHPRGHVVISGSRVDAVGQGPVPAGPEAERLDVGGRLVTPGLVNAHTHLYSALARGMPLPGFSPQGFRQILEQLWWKLDRALDLDLVYHSALVGGLAHLRAGVTALFDHHASPRAIDGALSAVKQAAVEEVGLRADLCYEVTDRGGVGQRDAGLAENLRFAREEADGERCAAHLGLHASFTLSDSTLERAAAAADAAKLAFHLHLAEGKEDPVDALHKYAVRTVERLDRFGILTEGTLLAHGIHLSTAEVELLAQRPATVIHNPRSNMNNAVGAAQVESLLARGVRAGLGTDGFGCDLLGELLTARILAHHVSGDPTAFADPTAAALLEQNYALAGVAFGTPMGKLAPGYAADLVVWDYTPPTPLQADNLLGHLLFAAISEGLRPCHVMVAGQFRLADGKVVDMDEPAVLARAREAAGRLWSSL